jgi:hypothetical protein
MHNFQEKDETARSTISELRQFIENQRRTIGHHESKLTQVLDENHDLKQRIMKLQLRLQEEHESKQLLVCQSQTQDIDAALLQAQLAASQEREEQLKVLSVDLLRWTSTRQSQENIITTMKEIQQRHLAKIAALEVQLHAQSLQIELLQSAPQHHHCPCKSEVRTIAELETQVAALNITLEQQRATALAQLSAVEDKYNQAKMLIGGLEKRFVQLQGQIPARS